MFVEGHLRNVGTSVVGSGQGALVIKVMVGICLESLAIRYDPF